MQFTDDDAVMNLVDERCPAVDARLLAEERDATLWRCFERLPARCQVLLRILLATPSPDYASVSAVLGMPTGSIGPTRGRCLHQLRKLAVGAGLVARNETQGVR
ncbi:MAG: hypothetical protein ABR608_10110 [Pseudonocardiaceae bacterium]